jgi:hypothetical protein
LSGIKIDNPVLNADGASEGNDHCIVSWRVSGVAKYIQYGVVKGLGLTRMKITLVSLYSVQYLQVQLLISASVAKVAAQEKAIVLALVTL